MTRTIKDISLGYSPCPNDTFIFYALVHGLIDTGELSFNEILLDVETLNQRALNCELDVTKVSFHALGSLRNDYSLLRSGSALGNGCGPLLVSKQDLSIKELKKMRVAIPGRLTTAYLLLQLFDADFMADKADIIVMPFNEIIEAVASGNADAGLIIHESRFTYSSFGLTKIMDLGQWWEDETGLPIPLGGIIARRNLGRETINLIDKSIHKSLDFAFKNRPAAMNYIKEHSQELSDDVIKEHIGLYVNELSLDLGAVGEEAVSELFGRAEKVGIIPLSDSPLFV